MAAFSDELYRKSLNDCGDAPCHLCNSTEVDMQCIGPTLDKDVLLCAGEHAYLLQNGHRVSSFPIQRTREVDELHAARAVTSDGITSFHGADKRSVSTITDLDAPWRPRHVTQEMILKAADKLSIRPTPAQSPAAFLATLSHVHLNNCKLTAVAEEEGAAESPLQQCWSVQKLYLYENRLTTISGLTGLNQLTHLYLQNNYITSLAGLEQLHSLQKLYLEGNSLARIERLGPLRRLRELHVSRQLLPEGQGVEFNGDCLEALSGSLEVLSAAQCGLQAVACLAVLGLLQALDLSGNAISDAAQVPKVLAGCRHLRSLSLQGNPICKQTTYRRSIVAASEELASLDGSEVRQQERVFLRRLSRSLSRRSMSGDGTADSARRVAAGSRRQSESGRLLQPSAASCEPATGVQTELHDIDEGEQQHQPRAPVQPVSSKPGSSGRRLSRGLSRGSSLCSVTELTM